jgi:hypothetical protein
VKFPHWTVAVLLILAFPACAVIESLPYDQTVPCGAAYCADQLCEPDTMTCDALGQCACTIQVWPDQSAPIFIPPPQPEPWHHHHEPPSAPEPHHGPHHHERLTAPEPTATPTPAAK